MGVYNDSNGAPALVNSEFAAFHPVLQPMRATCERWHERNDPRAWPIHAVLSITNGKPSFAQASAHQHFADSDDGEGQERP